MTVAFPYEEGNSALAARASLLGRLRGLGVETAEETTAPDPPQHRRRPPLPPRAQLRRRAPGARWRPDGALALLRSAGERGEAEAIGAEVAS